MPTYDFYCPDCEKGYEIFVKTVADVSGYCPACGIRLEKLVTAPSIHTGSGAKEDSRIIVQDFPDGPTVVTRETRDSHSTALVTPCGKAVVLIQGRRSPLTLEKAKQADSEMKDAYKNSRKQK